MNISYAITFLAVSAACQANVLTHLPHQSNQFVMDHLGIGRNYYVHYLRDFNGTRYLLKQKNNLFDELQRALQSVREVLGAYIAHKIGLQCQNVWIIPSNEPFVGKSFEGKPATLHQLVPGKMVRDVNRWKHLKIRQKGKLGLFQRGLQYHIIANMAQHRNLPPIVALDTITGNGGRHNKNFFYDEKTKSFWIIDMGGCYTHNQVKQSSINIEEMINNFRIQFDPVHLAGLRLYQETLKKIEERCPVDELIKQVELFLEQGQFEPRLRAAVFESIVNHIYESYSDLPVLHALIELLIMQKTGINQKCRYEDIPAN